MNLDGENILLTSNMLFQINIIEREFMYFVAVDNWWCWKDYAGHTGRDQLPTGPHIHFNSSSSLFQRLLFGL